MRVNRRPRKFGKPKWVLVLDGSEVLLHSFVTYAYIELGRFHATIVLTILHCQTTNFKLP
jgi:hypothetical protein